MTEILPEFWKEVAEGRIFLIERDLSNHEDLFLARPTATTEKKLPDRALSGDRRILRDGGRVNLFAPKCDYYRPYYVKLKIYRAKSFGCRGLIMEVI